MNRRFSSAREPPGAIASRQQSPSFPSSALRPTPVGARGACGQETRSRPTHAPPQTRYGTHAAAQAKPADPAPTPIPPTRYGPATTVVQAASQKTVNNIIAYTSIGQDMSRREIQEIVEEYGIVVKGHHSKDTTHGMNSATSTGIASFVEAKKDRKQKEKKAKAPQKKIAPLSSFEKAQRQAEMIFEEQGMDGLGDFSLYLTGKQEAGKLSEDEVEKLMDYYMGL